MRFGLITSLFLHLTKSRGHNHPPRSSSCKGSCRHVRAHRHPRAPSSPPPRMITQDAPHASLLAAAHADPKRRARLTSHAALLAANVLFGVGNIVSKVGLQATNPIVFALLREVVSGPLLLLISMRIERDSPVEQEGSAEAPAPGTRWEQIKRLRWRLLLNGGALWGTNLCYIVGVKLAGPTIGSIWQSAQPVTLTLMAVALRFEGCTAYKAGGVVLAFSGCLFVSVWGSAFQSDGLANMVIGNLVFFLQNLCISVYCLSQKQILRTFPPIAALAYAYFVASCLMAAVAGGISASPEALHRLCSDCKGNGWDIPVDAILAIAYWVVFGSMIGYFCCAWGNQHVHASVVGIYGSVQPVVTIIVAQLVIGLSQPPHYGLSTVNWADFGALAIFVGLGLVVIDSSRGHTTRALVDDERPTESPLRVDPASSSTTR